MAWRKVTEEDLTASMTIQEIEVYRKSGGWKSDPVTLILDRTVQLVRGYIRTNGKCVMSPDREALPESCIATAMDYAAANMMLRWGGKISEGRAQAKKDAIDFFGRVSRRWIIPEDYGAEEGTVVAGPATEVVVGREGGIDRSDLAGL